MNLPAILTPRELGDHLRASEDLVRAMANRGEIPGAFRVGKLWRFHRDLAVPHMAPRHDNVANEWQPNATHPYPSTSALKAADGGAYDGENTASSARNAATATRSKRKTVRPRSEHAFAAVFPVNASR